ncbi:hypothetical protein B0H19DRAFT_1260368 [Mycena capillaripes]|nr:hypothetical protein B0H19DRAFT_1260368 [Mycena capillaripes]
MLIFLPSHHDDVHRTSIAHFLSPFCLVPSASKFLLNIEICPCLLWVLHPFRLFLKSILLKPQEPRCLKRRDLLQDLLQDLKTSSLSSLGCLLHVIASVPYVFLLLRSGAILSGEPPILRSDPRILRSDLRSDLCYPPTFPPPSQTPSGRIPALRMALRM